MSILDADDEYDSLCSVFTECPKCDSGFRIDWDPGLVCESEPTHCAFCGEKIEYISTGTKDDGSADGFNSRGEDEEDPL